VLGKIAECGGLLKRAVKLLNKVESMGRCNWVSDGSRSKKFIRVGSGTFGLGKFLLEIQKKVIFFAKNKKIFHWSGSKNIWLKYRSASYLLRVKSMPGLGWIGSGPIYKLGVGVVGE